MLNTERFLILLLFVVCHHITGNLLWLINSAVFFFIFRDGNVNLLVPAPLLFRLKYLPEVIPVLSP